MVILDLIIQVLSESSIGYVYVNKQESADDVIDPPVVPPESYLY